MFKILLWYPWKAEKRIRTAADKVKSDSQPWHAAKSKAVFARRRSKSKLKLWTLELEKEKSEKKKEERESTQRIPINPCECLNSFKNAVKSSGETYIQFAARSTAKLPILLFVKKVNSLESLCDLIISKKLFETLNKETATHIGIREAEDWFRPIDLAKECDIYISSRSGSHKEIPITYGYTQDPFKNRSQNFKPKIKENYPQNLKEKK
ncbi:DUF1758 domain-containing protein [Trichonephila clavipes]|nr:DUF1758 domain-containing protein [Trichonephila clavipes]